MYTPSCVGMQTPGRTAGASHYHHVENATAGRPQAYQQVLDLVREKQESICEELRYCFGRIHHVMHKLTKGTLKETSFMSYGSSLLYLTALLTNIIQDGIAFPPSLQQDTLSLVQSIARFWQQHMPLCSGPAMAEGVRGLQVIPGLRPKHALLAAAKTTPSIPEWQERHEPSRLNRWKDLTMIATIEPVVNPDPGTVLRFAMLEVLQHMPRVHYRVKHKKSGRRYLVTAACEHRVYCATHIVLGLTEFGKSPITWASMEEIDALADIMSPWFISFHESHAEANGRYLYNKEMVIEIGIALFILFRNGCQLTEPVWNALLQQLRKLLNNKDRRANLRRVPTGARETCYVEIIANDQPRGLLGGLYVDYHMHYLVGLFYALLADSFGCPQPFPLHKTHDQACGGAPAIQAGNPRPLADVGLAAAAEEEEEKEEAFGQTDKENRPLWQKVPGKPGKIPENSQKPEKPLAVAKTLPKRTRTRQSTIDFSSTKRLRPAATSSSGKQKDKAVGKGSERNVLARPRTLRRASRAHMNTRTLGHSTQEEEDEEVTATGHNPLSDGGQDRPATYHLLTPVGVGIHHAPRRPVQLAGPEGSVGSVINTLPAATGICLLTRARSRLAPSAQILGYGGTDDMANARPWPGLAITRPLNSYSSNSDDRPIDLDAYYGSESFHGSEQTNQVNDLDAYCPCPDHANAHEPQHVPCHVSPKHVFKQLSRQAEIEGRLEDIIDLDVDSPDSDHETDGGMQVSHATIDSESYGEGDEEEEWEEQP
eukprot:g19395.t1